jgi:NAD-dependent dihydropyrimidine dehydrogenase PreA subunit
MAEPYVISQACIDVKDKACVEVCPVQCIYELVDGQLVGRDEDGAIVNTHAPQDDVRFLYEDRMLYIHPDECTSCDACLPVCPVDAIFPADRVPPDQKEFIDVNRFIFSDTSA